MISVGLSFWFFFHWKSLHLISRYIPMIQNGEELCLSNPCVFLVTLSGKLFILCHIYKYDIHFLNEWNAWQVTSLWSKVQPWRDGIWMVTTHTSRNVTDVLNQKCYSSEILSQFKILVLANTADTFKPVKLAVSFIIATLLQIQ